MADHQGTVRDVLDATGEVTRHIRYGAFGDVREVRDAQTGQLIGTGAAAASTRYLYTGREWDEAARLYYYRARSYDPFAGRFTSEDPLGLAAGDANFYRYVGNGPGNATGPTGLKKLKLSDLAKALQGIANSQEAKSEAAAIAAVMNYTWKLNSKWNWAALSFSHGIECATLDRSQLLDFLREVGQSRLVDLIDRYD